MVQLSTVESTSHLFRQGVPLRPGSLFQEPCRFTTHVAEMHFPCSSLTSDQFEGGRAEADTSRQCVPHWLEVSEEDICYPLTRPSCSTLSETSTEILPLRQRCMHVYQDEGNSLMDSILLLTIRNSFPQSLNDTKS